MGRAQGEAMAAEIHAAATFYEDLARPGDRLATAVAALSPFVDAARRYMPDLAAEVEGLAQGAQLDPDMAWLLNCMEEVWPFEACTTIASSRWLLHAEQWYAGHNGIGVVKGSPDDAPAFVSPTCAGFLPVVGMNSAGIAQGVDSLSARDERTGVPRLLVSRSVLGGRDLDHATRLTTLPERAGGYSYVLATADRSVSVETTATRSAVLPDEQAHTNHALSPALATVAPDASEGSVARLERARALLEMPAPRSLDDCIALLADHTGEPQTICLHADDRPGSSATVFGMVCDLTTGVVAVSAGPPCSSPWEEFAVPGFKVTESIHVV